MFLDVDENMKDDGKHEDDKYRVYRKLYNKICFFLLIGGSRISLSICFIGVLIMVRKSEDSFLYDL